MGEIRTSSHVKLSCINLISFHDHGVYAYTNVYSVAHRVETKKGTHSILLQFSFPDINRAEKALLYNKRVS